MIAFSFHTLISRLEVQPTFSRPLKIGPFFEFSYRTFLPTFSWLFMVHQWVNIPWTQISWLHIRWTSHQTSPFFVTRKKINIWLQPFNPFGWCTCHRFGDPFLWQFTMSTTSCFGSTIVLRILEPQLGISWKHGWIGPEIRGLKGYC